MMKPDKNSTTGSPPDKPSVPTIIQRTIFVLMKMPFFLFFVNSRKKHQHPKSKSTFFNTFLRPKSHFIHRIHSCLEVELTLHVSGSNFWSGLNLN